MSNEIALHLGQVLGIALASGLNLYATVAALGIASRLEWIETLPHGLRGLEHGGVLASASILFLVEFIVDKVRHLDSLWDTVHTVIRPTAAAFLAYGALSGAPASTELAGAALAGIVALAAHTTKAGLRISLNAKPSTAMSVRISIGEDALAVALALAAIAYPVATLSVAAAALLLVALVGPRLWRAFVLGLRALAARLRGFFGQARWRPLDELPAPMRQLVEPPGIGQAEPRATRAALEGLRGTGAYRNGWLVVTESQAIFLYRAWFAPRRVLIPPARNVQARDGVWADCLDIETDEGRCTLYLLKDGPRAELALADFTRIRST